jgi:hypothetical protein
MILIEQRKAAKINENLESSIVTVSEGISKQNNELKEAMLEHRSAIETIEQEMKYVTNLIDEYNPEEKWNTMMIGLETMFNNNDARIDEARAEINNIAFGIHDIINDNGNIRNERNQNMNRLIQAIQVNVNENKGIIEQSRSLF